MRVLLLVIIALNALIVRSQSGHSDCSDALVLVGNSFKSDEVKGYGQVLEFSNNELGNEYYFTEEHNTIWLSFTVPAEGDLTFTITGGDNQEDWDFILYSASLDECDDIIQKKIKPIRSNLSRNKEDELGRTGLDAISHDEFVGAGINPSMSKWLEVKSKEQFILVVDNSTNSNDGFDLSIHVSEIVKEIHIEEEVMVDESDGFAFADMTDDEEIGENITMKFLVLNETNNEEVECQAEIIGVQWTSDSLTFDGQSSFEAQIPKDKWFYINVKKEGYTFGTEKFKASEALDGSTQTIYISKIEEGKHIVLSQIVFRENTTHMLPTSINALEQLIEFMNEYPSARIEVQGHVNAPGYENEGKVKKFSLKRAEQIKEYLIDAGIDGRRIEIVGMGNEFMIYPSPQNYEQEKANRRVEIEILSY